MGVLSVSSMHVGPADGLSQHSVENEPAVGSFASAATAPELHPVDTTDVVKVGHVLFGSLYTQV